MTMDASAAASRRVAELARVVALTFSIGGALATEARPAEAEQIARAASTPAGRIVVLGDSLAISPAVRESFPTQLQAYLSAAKVKLTVVNAGIRGDTTSGGLRRVRPLLTTDTRLLMVELGVNDGLRGVEIPQIERNLSAIIETAQNKRIPVLLCGMLVPPNFGWEYALAFPQMFRRIATKYQVPLVPFLLDGVALVAHMNGPDGIHPNAAGARRIADTVWRYLEPMVRDKTNSAESSGS